MGSVTVVVTARFFLGLGCGWEGHPVEDSQAVVSLEPAALAGGPDHADAGVLNLDPADRPRERGSQGHVASPEGQDRHALRRLARGHSSILPDA